MFLAAFRFTLALGLVTGVVFFFIVGLEKAMLVGAAYAVVGGVLFTLSDTIATPSVADDRASTPASVFRGDRAMTTVHILAVGITNLVALGIAFGWRIGVLIAVTFALVGSIGTSIKVSLPGGKSVLWPFGFSAVGSAWASFLATKLLLAKRKKSPLRLMGFLERLLSTGTTSTRRPLLSVSTR